MSLIASILSVKGDYRAQQQPDGELFPNVQNYGLPAGRCAVRHKKGDYHQFAVRAEEDIPPLLTHLRVAEGVRALDAGEFAESADWLTVREEFERGGEGVLHAVVCLWLDQNRIPVPETQREKASPLRPELQRRLLLTRTDPMPFALSIAAVGCADDTGTSVVPEDWLGRRFHSGQEICRAIDTLPHRQGRPEAHYCTHYGLKRVEEPRWLAPEAIAPEILPTYGISLWVDQAALHTSIQKLDAATVKPWMESLPARVRFLQHETGLAGGEEEGRAPYILIACDTAGMCEPVPTYQKTASVGLLASRLQKSLRRGRGAAGTLARTVEQLRAAPAYNLPDDHFKRSSGSRQLAWRLFISIFEDVEPYAPAPDGDYLSLPDLVALGILAHAEPHLQFNRFVTDKLLRTALLVQRNDAPGKNWNWRVGGKRTPITGTSEMERACAAALDCMPMMKRDAEMLRQGCEHLGKARLTLHPLEHSWSNEEMLQSSEPGVERDTLLSSFDFHCSPAILLHLQAALPKRLRLREASLRIDKEGSKKSRAIKQQPGELALCLPTTQNLKRFIWENVSRINTRNPQHAPAPDSDSQALLREIQAIQRTLLDGEEPSPPHREACGTASVPATPPPAAGPLLARTAFIALFGQAIELPAAGPGSNRRLKDSFAAVVAGSPHEPCKIKKKRSGSAAFLKGVDRRRGEEDLVDYLAASDGVEIELPPAPAGHRWAFDATEKKVRLRITHHLETAELSENAREADSEGPLEFAEPPLSFRVENQMVPAFDAGCLLEPRQESTPVRPCATDEILIRRALYLAEPGETDGQWTLQQHLRILARHRREQGELDLEWMELAEQSPLPAVVWQRTCTKLLGTFLGRVTIGPVDRQGEKLYAAVDYLHEGTLWRAFNLLAFVYPQSVQPCGELDFKINNQSASYLRLIQDLERLAAPGALSSSASEAPRVTSPLWQHQTSSLERITEEILKNGRKGFGDASDVGSGKTLTSLAILCNLARHNLETHDATAESFLVLVYNETLVQTWKDEIAKHTSGFHFVTQSASGELSAPLQRHSILVTTLNRMRDTPVTRRWHMVVIDECLSVQNASALWTQEAWNQVSCSQRGVLLLSATFFRSRFNELFYLLRMLRTGLPETRPYLDAILSECITCHLPENTPWKWIEETRWLPLDAETRTRYDQIQHSSGAPKMLYGRLDALLVESFDFAAHLGAVLDGLKPGSRALIFGRSESEARAIAASRGDTGLFPDITKRHVVTTTAKAARGVNTLTAFNVLISRPVEPDLVPQMKGRLARPGQENGELRWIWMVIQQTIEEAKMERNQMAERFHGEHILPLASFYQRALELSRKSR